MSNPTATGEWTVAEVVMMGCDAGPAAYDIAHNHNAALAAEREVGGNTAIALAQQITKLEAQLAAEHKLCLGAIAAAAESQKQLAAAVEALKEIKIHPCSTLIHNIIGAALAKIGDK